MERIPVETMPHMPPGDGTFDLLVNCDPATALFDTGSQLTIIHCPFYHHIPLQPVGPVTVFVVGKGPTYMDSCVEVQLHIPGLVWDQDPPLTVIAYVGPPPGGRETGSVIVGCNVKAVEDAFIHFLETRGTTLPIAPELQEICQTFTLELPGGCVGNLWHPVELPSGGVQSLKLHVAVSFCLKLTLTKLH